MNQDGSLGSAASVEKFVKLDGSGCIVDSYSNSYGRSWVHYRLFHTIDSNDYR